MTAMASQITDNSVFCLIACSTGYQRKHWAPPYWPFVRGIYWGLVDSLHKGPVMWKSFPCHDAIMACHCHFKRPYPLFIYIYKSSLICTVRCRYNAINFFSKSWHQTPIARPSGSFVSVIPDLCSAPVPAVLYVKLDCSIITAPNCIYYMLYMCVLEQACLLYQCQLWF